MARTEWEPRTTESFLKDVNKLLNRQERRLVATKGLAAGLQEDIGLVDAEMTQAKIDLAAAQQELEAAQVRIDDAFLAVGTAQFTADGASAQAGTALSRADAAIVAAGDATTAAGDATSAAQQAAQKATDAQGVAAQAAADALAAAGVAAGKGKVIYQVSKPTGANAVAGNLWIRSSDGKTFAYDATVPDWVAVTDPQVIAAAAAAAAATQAAQAAQSAADAAASTANARPLILFGTATPSGTAPYGSTWFQIDASGNIKGQWQQTATGNAGSTWTSRPITSDVIANLDVGKLTAGTALIANAVLQKIAAGTANIQTANIANLFVTQGATMAQATIEALYAQVVRAHQITADMIDVTTLNGITLTGVVVQTSASGKRVVLSDNRINFYGVDGSTAVNAGVIEGIPNGAAGGLISIASATGGTSWASFGSRALPNGGSAGAFADTAWVETLNIRTLVNVNTGVTIDLEDTGWIYPTLDAGQNSTADPFGVRRKNGIVYFCGLILPTAAPQTFYTMGTKYRPKASVGFILNRGGTSSSLNAVLVRIGAAGNIVFTGPSTSAAAGAYVDMAGISGYPAVA